MLREFHSKGGPTQAQRILGGNLRIAVIRVGVVLVLCATSPQLGSAAELAVIVNPEAGVVELTRAQLINIFFGRQRRLPSGQAALPIDLAGEGGVKAQFYGKLVEKSLAEVRSYWARLVFSGQGSAPWQAQSTDEVLGIIEENRGAIGYIPAHQADHRVRIVYLLQE